MIRMMMIFSVMFMLAISSARNTMLIHRYGLSEPNPASIITSIIIGGILFFVAVGWLASIGKKDPEDEESH